MCKYDTLRYYIFWINVIKKIGIRKELKKGGSSVDNKLIRCRPNSILAL